MKSLTSALSAALSAPVQRPALLVEARFAVTQRWSSAGTVTWNGQTWTGRDMTMEGLLVEPLRVSGTLVLGNTDDVVGNLVLTEGAQDKTIIVHAFDAAALSAVSDAVWLCDAVGSAARIGPQEVRISLRHPTEFVQSPRTYVTAAAGFNHLLPGGTVVRINGIDMRLDRRT